MAFNFLKNLDADDIFISYSRRDGSAYLTGLDAALSKRGFSCFTDKRGTDAGRLPPETLYRKVRACKTLVLLASPGAQEWPENITPELREFAEDNGTSRIICVSFDGGVEFDDFPDFWHDFVIGKAREREAPAALVTGTPSEAVVAAVVAASDYMKSKDRLRKYRNRAIGVLGALVVAIAVAAVIAGVMFRQAAAATKEAAAATTKANEATVRADAETARAAQATQEAKAAQDDAERQKAEAEKQKGEATKQKELADRATKDAQEKTKVADAATARAEREQARAERQGTIADARSLANRSQTVLRQRGDVPASLGYAVASMQKASGVGVHAIEADTALRESLALLPRLRSSQVYARAEEPSTALSPDGRHFVRCDAGATITVYESGRLAKLKEIDTECDEVALSSGGVYAATLIKDENKGVKIFDLKSGTSRTLPLADDFIPGLIALSPGGRYLALASRYRYNREEGRQLFMVIDLSSGKVIKSFDLPKEDTLGVEEAAVTAGEPAPGRNDAAHKAPTTDAAPGACGGDPEVMPYALAFGPNGILALGGYDGGGLGRAALWPLKLKTSDGGGEPELTAASFDNPEVVQLPGRIEAIAPGADMTYFATDAGVWRKTSVGGEYEPAAGLPYVREYESLSSIRSMAFDPGGGSLTLDRLLRPTVDPDHSDAIESVLEVWDAAGYSDMARVPQPGEVVSLGFKPGGQFVVAMTVSNLSAQFLHLGRVYQTRDGAEMSDARFEWEPTSEYTSSPPVDPDGRRYFAPDGGQVLDVWGKKTTVEYGGALAERGSVTFSRGGKFLVMDGKDKKDAPLVSVYRLDGDTYREWKNIPQPKEVRQVSLSADGQRLAVRYRDIKGTLKVWDVGNARDVSPESLKRFDWQISYNNELRMMLSHDGRFLVMTDDRNRTWLHDLSGGRAAEMLLDPTHVHSLAVSPDNRYIGISSYEGLLHVFDMKGDGGVTEIARLQHTGRVTAVAFSDDNKYVATASTADSYGAVEGDEFPLRIWLLQPEDLLAEAKARAESLRKSGP